MGSEACREQWRAAGDFQIQAVSAAIADAEQGFAAGAAEMAIADIAHVARGGIIGAAIRHLESDAAQLVAFRVENPDRALAPACRVPVSVHVKVNSIPEGVHIHVDYDGKDLEIVSPSMIHDGSRGLLGRVVALVAEVCEIPIKSEGQTTWKRPEIARGLESDESYFFRDEKLAAVAKSRARRSMKIADYPNPDLAIKVDVTPPKVDRPGIYTALKVDEVWRFEGVRAGDH